MAAVFILLAVAVSLHARGAGEENVLSRADALIENREYDEAVSLLTDYIKTNPDYFGEAQARLQRIIKIRERYNATANELLNILETDPENNEKILELSRILASIESPSNQATRLFLAQIEDIAELNINRIRLERIFESAREQLEADNFSGALNTYASGLDLYQNEFFSAGYGEEAEATASEGLTNIEHNIQNFNSLTAPFSASAQSIVSMNAGALTHPEELRTSFSVFVPLMEELTALSESFFAIRRSFDERLAILQEDHPQLGDRSFLSFAGRLVTGPAEQNEGMTGTLDRYLRFWAGQMETALLNIIEASYSSGFTSMREGEISAGTAALNETVQYTGIILDLLDEWNNFLFSQEKTAVVMYGETVAAEKAGDYLKFRALSGALDGLVSSGEIMSRDVNESASGLSLWRQGALDTQEAFSSEQNARESYQAIINDLAVLENEINSEIEAVVSYNEELGELLYETENPQSSLVDTRDFIAGVNNNFRTQEYNSAVRQYTIANGDLQTRLREREAEFNEGNTLIQGVSRTLEGTEQTVAYYPTEGVEILSVLNQNLEVDIATARELTNSYASENYDSAAAQELDAMYALAQAMLNQLLNLESRSNQAIASARTQVQRAASLRFEGNRLFEAAQIAMGRNDFTAARSNLERAKDQYNASLAIQESESLRAIWDNQLVSLGDEIVRLENEIVVRDVRELLTNARTLYYAGSMDRAEEALIRAQNRWRVTNVIEHQEVEYWLGLVRGAMSLQSGRIIAVTAPLYAEMSQLLSDAKRNFDEGVRLINSSSRQDGIARFNDAMAKTREVRLMFPMNQEARMIELRIEQQTDQSAFNASFRQRLNEAVAGTKPGIRSVQSFADLQDLAAINPGYPGIQTIIVQAEIDMNFRPPPPDPMDIARSAELTRTAQSAVTTRDTSRYEVAQAQLEEAIRLNQNNTQAQSLLDQLSVLMRGTGVIVIDSASQAQYDLAIQMYNQGNYLRANAIVEQLLQNPNNQKSTQILELKRRIDAVL